MGIKGSREKEGRRWETKRKSIRKGEIGRKVQW